MATHKKSPTKKEKSATMGLFLGGQGCRCVIPEISRPVAKSWLMIAVLLSDCQIALGISSRARDLDIYHQEERELYNSRSLAGILSMVSDPQTPSSGHTPREC
jgi:hypothetical protein